MHTTKTARELYKLQDFYRLLALCENEEVAEEARRRAKEAHRLILRLVDIENASRDMRIDYDKLIKDTCISSYDVTAIDSGSILESFPSESLAEAYLKRLRIEDGVAAEIVPVFFSADCASHWNMRTIWEMNDELLLDFINE